MDEKGFRVPYEASESEFVEKRSRFISHLWPVETEEEAQAHIREMKSKYYDARHNCWCYLIGKNVMRYSDDGEPQGTAGQPMLKVFERENVTNVCCVVTRYFGGILLGTGGLVRAYSQSTSLAIDAAGVGECRPCAVGEIACDYAQYGRVAPLVAEFGGRVTDTAFTEGVTLSVLLPSDRTAAFCRELTEISAGSLNFQQNDEIFEFFEKK